MGRYVSAYVSIDLEDVLDDVSASEIEELLARKDRPISRRKDVALYFSDWDFEAIKSAVLIDDGRRLVDLLKPALAEAA